MLIWYGFYNSINIQMKQEFDKEATDIIKKIEKRIQSNEQILLGGKGLFEASSEVERAEWHEYIMAQKIKERFPGIQGVGYSIRLEDTQQLDALEEKIRAQELDWFKYRPREVRDEYHTIIFLEPLDERNKNAIGYDMYSEPTRKHAMEYARDNDKTSISGKVVLVQEITKDVQPGFLLYVPIYKNNLSHDTLDEKKKNLQGFVYSPLRAHDFFNGINLMSNNELAFAVYDNEENNDNLLFEKKLGSDFDDTQIMTNTQTLKVFNRDWIIPFKQKITYSEIELGVLITIPIIGGSLSTLLFYTIRSYNRTNTRIVQLIATVDEVTKGDLLKELPEKLLKSDDSIGKLAYSFRTMQTELNRNEELLKKTIDELTETKRELELERNLLDQKIQRQSEKLVKSEKLSAIGAVTSRIAHDLRNPIAVIANTVEIMRASHSGDKVIDSHFMRIDRALSRISHQINDVLDFIRITPLKIENVEFGSFIRQVISRVKVPEKIQIQITGDVIFEGDLLKLESVFVNLILNSIQALNNTGTIAISASEVNSKIIMQVTDSGPGIPKEDLPKIFEPLFTTKQTGTGLGLVSCKTIIEQHGGAISIDINPTRVNIEIPKMQRVQKTSVVQTV